MKLLSKRHHLKLFYIQILRDVRSSYVPKCPARVKFCAGLNWVYTRMLSNISVGVIEVLLKSEVQHTGTWPTAAWLPVRCVIAQQYSSATSLSLRFLCRKEIFGAYIKYIIITFF
jgi:hypothetical protein